MTPDREEIENQASLYVAGALTIEEQEAFEAQLRANPELAQLTASLQQAMDMVALASPPVALPAHLKGRVMHRVDELQTKRQSVVTRLKRLPGFAFHAANDKAGWKDLPIPGASLKLLSIDRERNYAVLLGRLGPGVRYPAHEHVLGEELYILTGDLNIGDRTLQPGDFHHADAGTRHGVNYSVEGCTLLAVLPADHELVQFAVS